MILVTGATGFVGSALVKRLMADTAFGGVVAALRRDDVSLPASVKCVYVGDLLPTTDWHLALQKVDTVVHCAASTSWSLFSGMKAPSLAARLACCASTGSALRPRLPTRRQTMTNQPRTSTSASSSPPT